MNMGSKNKKRMVLPSRPAPPTVEQVLEDIHRASPNDPVFGIRDNAQQDPTTRSTDSDVELKFQQSRRYLELNEKLQEARGQLAQQREELQAVGQQLECTVAEVKGRAL